MRTLPGRQPKTPDLSNRAWQQNLRALREDWEAGELTDDEFFKLVIDGATPATARGSLVVIGDKASNKFDHWFTALYGTELNINLRVKIPGGVTRDNCHPHNSYLTHKQNRLIEAFHRAVLDRRELE